MELRTRERLTSVFRSALDLDDNVSVESLRHRDHPNWNSVGHLALVVAIEDEFDVEFDTDQLIGMDTFHTALRTLAGLGVAD
ncbi:acyl carrier protein [Micromonospora okii]|uniref:acyl carrier protein n=1 Tax=Micromonospora okii TaxID=1182970 RepID=UPI001E3B6D22|nr:acyl carrier protein [Micromonospora okii]